MTRVPAASGEALVTVVVGSRGLSDPVDLLTGPDGPCWRDDERMTILEYRVPVFVEVDEEAGVVRWVRVDDESIEGPVAPDESALPGQLNASVGALAIAEGADWPAWEFGV